MRASASVRSFSLIEVIIAVAVFAVSVSAILALLLPLSRLGAQSADRLTGQRLPDALKVELQRLSSGGFDALVAEVPAMGEPLANGLAFVATRDGSQLHSRDYHPPPADRIADEDRYFLVECWRFPDGALRYEAGQTSLALAVRVSWPAGGSAAREQHELMFAMSLNR